MHGRQTGARRTCVPCWPRAGLTRRGCARQVQHPSIAAPFLSRATVVHCNGKRGFAQGDNTNTCKVTIGCKVIITQPCYFYTKSLRELTGRCTNDFTADGYCKADPSEPSFEFPATINRAGGPADARHMTGGDDDVQSYEVDCPWASLSLSADIHLNVLNRSHDRVYFFGMFSGDGHL
jgi:hypothetical protein